MKLKPSLISLILGIFLVYLNASFSQSSFILDNTDISSEDLNDEELDIYNFNTAIHGNENVILCKLKPSKHHNDKKKFKFRINNVKYTVFPSSVRYKNDFNYTWYGEDNFGGYAHISSYEDKYSGRLYLDNNLFLIKQISNDRAILVKIDDSIPSECGADIETDPPKARDKKTTARSCSNVIRVGFYFTPSASTYVGNIQAEAQSYIDYANTALLNSGINAFRYEKTEALILNSTSTGTNLDYSENVKTIQQLYDTFIDDNASRSRAQEKGSDVRFIIINQHEPGFINTNVEGVAWLYCSFCDPAGSYLERSKAVAHELAHLLNARHEDCSIQPGNKCVDSSDPNFNFPLYARGHIGNGIKTIMSYGSNSTIPYFSTPHKSYNGKPVGTANIADNTRAMNTYYCGRASFRTGPDDEINAMITGPVYLDPGGLGIFSPYSYGTDPGPFNYLWEYSYTGFTYQYLSNNRYVSFNIPTSNYPDFLYLRLTITSIQSLDHPVINQETVFHQVEIDSGGGIEQRKSQIIDSNNKISIYPNPATNFLHVEIESNVLKNISFGIYGTDGTKRLYRNVQVDIGFNSIKLNNLDLPPGVYFLVLDDIIYYQLIIMK